MQMKALLTMIATVLILSGCTGQGQQTSTLNSFWPQNQKPNAALTALHGGIIDPQVTATWSRVDRTRALEAEYQALEMAPSGEVIAWQGKRPGISGEVFAGQAYTVGSQHCRQVSHTVNENGRTISSRGTACRDENGNWAPLA